MKGLIYFLFVFLVCCGRIETNVNELPYKEDEILEIGSKLSELNGLYKAFGKLENTANVGFVINDHRILFKNCIDHNGYLMDSTHCKLQPFFKAPQIKRLYEIISFFKEKGVVASAYLPQLEGHVLILDVEYVDPSDSRFLYYWKDSANIDLKNTPYVLLDSIHHLALLKENR